MTAASGKPPLPLPQSSRATAADAGDQAVSARDPISVGNAAASASMAHARRLGVTPVLLQL